jgi:alkaline phosphatase D
VALLEKYALGGGKYDEDGIELYLLNIYRWYYRVYWSVPALRVVYESFPQYMIWDDHEIMDGWGSLTNKERRARISGFFEEKDSKTNQLLVDLMWRAACRAYYEYEHSHNPPTAVDLENPDNSQWDYAFTQGDAAFYVLDMRGHHDVEKNKGKKNGIDPNIILGQAQFDRFTAWLASSEAQNAKALFVVSPVPVVHWIDRLVNYVDLGEAKDDFMDEWGHETNWTERNQLLETVFRQIDKSGRKLVFLSGDVHCASVFRMQHRKFPAARVYQVTSSAISRKPAPKISLIGISSGGAMDGNKDVSCERLYALTGAKNFAMIRFKSPLPGADAEIIVDLHWPGGEEGEVTKRRVVL